MSEIGFKQSSFKLTGADIEASEKRFGDDIVFTGDKGEKRMPYHITTNGACIIFADDYVCDVERTSEELIEEGVNYSTQYGLYRFKATIKAYQRANYGQELLALAEVEAEDTKPHSDFECVRAIFRELVAPFKATRRKKAKTPEQIVKEKMTVLIKRHRADGHSLPEAVRLAQNELRNPEGQSKEERKPSEPSEQQELKETLVLSNDGAETTLDLTSETQTVEETQITKPTEPETIAEFGDIVEGF